MITPTCRCGSSMDLRRSSRFTYRDGSPRPFYGCSRWPACDGTAGAHPDGTPSSIPCDAATKAERGRTHDLLDRLWDRRLNPAAPLRRPEAYGLLAFVLAIPFDDAHVGYFDADRCRAARRRLAGLFPAVATAARAATTRPSEGGAA